MQRNQKKVYNFTRNFICIIFIVVLFAPFIYAQNKEEKQEQIRVWEQNCALRNIYWTELIFSATETEDGVFWVAEDRESYFSVFNSLVLENEPKLKSRRDKIIKLIKKSPGDDRVIISSELMREVDKLWDDIANKAQSLDIQCQ